ncbi:DUF6191 domain-containing protein [Actinokineospora sp. 24-640]
MTLPGLVLLLVVVAAVEAFAKRGRRGADGLPVSAAGLEDFAGVFQANKLIERDHKAHSLMMRDEVGDNAPPRTVVDFSAGTVRLVVPPVKDH